MTQNDIDGIKELIGEVNDAAQLFDIARCATTRGINVQRAHRATVEEVPIGQPYRRAGRSTPNEKGFVVGQTVKFNANTTKYLCGRTVEVVKTNAKSVKVKVPNEPGYGRFAGLSNCGCPNSIIEAA